MIHISQAAATEIKRVQMSRNQPDSLFRLRVKEGGCSGLFYSLELEEHSRTSNSFGNNARGDLIYESQDIYVVVDELSYSSVRGLKLDYSEDLMGGGFRFQNPNAINTCSCGLSFAIN
ncbi:iron-sulfur cluster assembly accessory protein [Pleurocapsales cyanobacterium LEGE 06147]|nr:iron-sulfur cluster assembly accessory protein [Pleurocapsales cyanobacterium LEGE 06147]